MVSGVFPGNSNYEAQLTASVDGSTVEAVLKVEQDGGSGYYGNGLAWRINIDGVGYDGTWSYDFTTGSDVKTVATRSRAGRVGVVTVRAWVEMSFGRSPTLELDVTVTAKPGAPGAPSLELAADNRILATWAAAAANGDPIDRYQVHFTRDPKFETGINSAYIDTDRVFLTQSLTQEIAFYFRVRAENGEGWGPWSAVRSFTVPGPSAPPSSRTFSRDAGELTYSWSAASIPSGVTLVRYDVWLATVSSPDSAGTVIPVTSGRTWSGPAPTLARTWYAKVRVVTSQGVGEWSAPSSLYVPGVPSTPVVTISNPGLRQFQVVWPTPTSDRATLDHYEIEVDGLTEPYNEVFERGILPVGSPFPNTLNMVGGSIYPSHDYRARVRAFNEMGPSAWSEWALLSTFAAVYVSDGTDFDECELYVSTGTKWKPVTELSESDGEAWRRALAIL